MRRLYIFIRIITGKLPSLFYQCYNQTYFRLSNYEYFYYFND
ncbi:hypothetical protein D1AOALGA4SA_5485 [Olavius algarvensis Delta 1 endosymbiont]|nr:hypothetical protein D1AOALGA4SA_5485 [Olavius algarvensis Delta 1 endosymbiont]